MVRRMLPPEGESGEADSTTFRVNYAGELVECRTNDAQSLTLAYNGTGRESVRRSGRGFMLSQEYDATGKLVTQRAGREAAGSLAAELIRRYEYDGAQNLVAVNDDHQELRYAVNGNGQVTTVSSRDRVRERYGYDDCGYLKEQWTGEKVSLLWDNQYAQGHRLKRAGNTEYDYDAAGRMISRTKHRDGYRPEKEQFRWDRRDQLTGYSRESGGKSEQWAYRYDGSGRRTEKRCDQKGIRITYLWDGDNIAEIREYRDDKLYSVRHLVFNGFELLSQQYGRERQAHPTEPVRWTMRTVHAVSEQTGRPLMLFNSAGEAARRPQDVTLWGQPATAATADYEPPRQREDEETDPGLLYAGQWRDAESGLCYNRFRYYEPESGMYLVSDPLGLAGGEQTYRYVPNPCGYVDSLGLATCPLIKQRVLANLEASRAARESSNFKPNYRTGSGYGVNDKPVRIDGTWSKQDIYNGLYGRTPKGLGSPDLHHAGQMPGSGVHEVLPGSHRGNTAMHPNKYNQGVTPDMRNADRQLHWWYRAREQGADDIYPGLIYD